jgi:hypothetical protein
MTRAYTHSTKKERKKERKKEIYCVCTVERRSARILPIQPR